MVNDRGYNGGKIKERGHTGCEGEKEEDGGMGNRGENEGKMRERKKQRRQ